MRYLLITTLWLFAITAIAAESVPELHIDKNRITVSGISSGAAMAHQLHIAYSDLFSGAAILSGVPYNCAENSLITALKRCTSNIDQPLPVDEFAAYIAKSAEAGSLADPANLANDRVFLFHGKKDITVSSLVHNATAKLYSHYIPAENILQVNEIEAGHVFPAMDASHGCSEMTSPFVGDCDYDGAGELLGYLYSGLVSPDAAEETNLLSVDMPGADDAGLMPTAYLFIPPACSEDDKACALHLVLHGCAQSAETVGTDFIRQSGYLPWAEANDIVLAFPQVEKSLVVPLNPHGCWDWWGYTGEDYANRNGKQMAAVTGWIKALSR